MLSIRTQDRLALVPYNDEIYIDTQDARASNTICMVSKYGYKRILGTYKTKERASEVLDYISNFMTQQSEQYMTLNMIYQMPKE